MLLVEGSDDRYVLEYLCKTYQLDIPIRYSRGEGNLSEDLAVRLKEEALLWLGLIVDIDQKNPQTRLKELRQWHPALAKLPPLQPKGLIQTIEREGGMPSIRFGLWCMPDNLSHGGLEDFLIPFIPPSRHWDYSKRACHEAKNQGAPFPERHLSKARLRTWLAWQKTPGLALGRALEKGYFFLPPSGELHEQSPILAALLAWIEGMRSPS